MKRAQSHKHGNKQKDQQNLGYNKVRKRKVVPLCINCVPYEKLENSEKKCVDLKRKLAVVERQNRRFSGEIGQLVLWRKIFCGFSVIELCKKQFRSMAAFNIQEALAWKEKIEFVIDQEPSILDQTHFNLDRGGLSACRKQNKAETIAQPNFQMPPAYHRQHIYSP
ncbi:unnamed protein product [Dovyalis caffra]|uniref:Uncharacterized protein n=1 Tax=Dovyalis caffra TaxID=77055 RepID=A0AAV1QT07_9ROSI|nr:unnamed protein product [Dovyalis caffra]